MSKKKLSVLVVGSCLAASCVNGNTVENFPPQDRGLPYTRSAYRAAMGKIGDHIAVFAGSRYANVYGKRVRLNDNIKAKAEAVMEDGEVFVPIEFAGIISLSKDQFKTDRVPEDLGSIEDRWVYTVERPEFKIPATVKTIVIKGQKYFSVAGFAETLGKKVYQNPRGLVIVGDSKISFDDSDPALLDTVISQFDTPEKLADPDIATKYIPLLKAQGPWYEHAKATPEQRKLLSAPEVEWPLTPIEKYDFTGFDKSLLGSKVPAQGMYPRILFSPEDIPMLAERIKKNKFAQKAMIETEVLLEKSWWDPATSDGQVFEKLAKGDLENLQFNPGRDGVVRPCFASTFKGQKPGIYSSHINYNAQCLVTMALYCLITGNDERGKQVANAIYNFCKLGEPAIDAHLAMSDSEWGVDYDKANNAATHWRGMHGVVPHMDLPFLLDFGGKWMNEEQKDLMRRVIVKATYGRRTGAGDGPKRNWRDINHMTWHLTHGLAITAIEGLKGFDPEAYDSHAELTRDFCEWGIDKFGQIFESNGKNGGGLQFQILSMIALARRGDNLWGHPHWRKLLEAQVYTTAPNGKTTVSSGTWGSSALSAQSVNEIKAFYPENHFADYLLTNAHPDLDWEKFNPDEYRKKLQGPKGTFRLRLPGPSYPGFCSTFIYDTDWKKTGREELKMPLDWNDSVHGMMSTASENSSDASWLCLHIRANHYMGSGHHHADEGMFYFSGLGVNWLTESPIINNYDGRFHSLVLIDGKSEPDGPPAAAKYLGATLEKDGAIGTADLSYAYSWRWCTQVMMWKDDWMTTSSGEKRWELETDPENLRYYQGTERYKMRPWWPTYTFSNFMPNVRAPYNPVEYVFRSTGLIRGKNSYGLIIDDLRKDDKEHLYQWNGILGPGVWQARSDELPRNQVWLAWDKTEKRHHAGEDYLRPRKGDPVLLVCALGLPDPDPKGPRPIGTKSLEGPGGRWNAQTFYDSLLIDIKADLARYRLLLIPMKYQDKMPVIEYDDEKQIAKVSWDNQQDEISFQIGKDGRTRASVKRNGKTIMGTIK